MDTKRILKTAFSTGDYYKSMNDALRSLNGHYHMLHYPLYLHDDDSFAGAQKNLIRYCLSKIPSLDNKHVLDIGCGNGMVALYIADHYQVHKIGGVDLNSNNISIANKEKETKCCTKSEFAVGDAQDLHQIPDSSTDVVISIESAFHYPDKNAFLKEVRRILKPGGHFVIADILTTRNGNAILRKWKRRMNFHHWSLHRYIRAFDEVELSLHSKEDISDDVILGFKAYKKYLKGFRANGFFRTRMLKLFFVINAKLNIYLLNRRRRYYIFYGMN